MIRQWTEVSVFQRVTGSRAQLRLRKRYSTARAPERINVPCHSNGNVLLESVHSENYFVHSLILNQYIRALESALEAGCSNGRS